MSLFSPLFCNLKQSFLKGTKQWIPVFAIGMGYQFEAPQHSFFQTAPSSEEVLNETLQERENISPVEALKTLPGIVVLGSEITTYTGSLFLRGANADHTLFIWNDLRADDFTSPAGAVDPFSFSTEFSNRIRVLKGPQSLLYGTQALGGVVLIDDDPDLDSSLGLAGGSANTAKGVAEVRHHTEHTSLSVGASGLSTEGISAFNAPVPRGGSGSGSGAELEKDGRHQTSGTGIFTAELGHADQVQVLLNSSESLSNDDVPPLDDINASTQHRSQQWKLRYKKSWSEPLQSVFILTGQETSRDSKNPSDAFSSDEYQDLAKGQRYGFLNRNTLNAGGSLWHFGVEAIQDRGDFYSRSTFLPVPSSFQSERQEQSAYVVNDWSFARSDFSWGTRGSCQEGAACIGVYQLSYQLHWPEQQRSLYGIVSTGLKRPTLYQLFSSYGDAQLKSETSQAFEVGLLQRWGLANKVKVSLFHNRFSNLIDYDFATTRYQNLNKARTYGVEFLHQYDAVFWDSELSLTSISATDESQGARLLRRPNYQAAWTLGYSVLESLRLLNEWIYLGDREDNDATGTRMTLPAITLWNTALIYKIDKQLQVFGRVNNAGNSFFEDIHGYLTPGRFYWVGMKFSF